MALKKIVSITLCVCMLLLVLTGCNLFGGGKDKPSDPTSTNGGNNSNNGGEFDFAAFGLDEIDLNDPFWLNYDFDNFDIADVFEPLGDATFTVDSANKTTGEFTPGKPFTLSLTDSAGMKWTLDIPDDALLNPTTITMTALCDVRINGGDPFNGVLMEPDGLYFLTPATLTMSGGNYSKDYAMYQSNHDGTGVTPLYYINDGNGASANLYHFSAGLLEWPRPSKKARQALLAVINMCRTQLVMPEPPSMSFKCKPNHAKDPNEEAALEKFLKEFKEPEWTLYQWILPQCKGIDFSKDSWSHISKKVMFGKDSDGKPMYGWFPVPNPNYFNADEREYIAAMSILVSRINGKVVRYFDKYKYQEDKFKAIGHASRWAGDLEKAFDLAMQRLMNHESSDPNMRMEDATFLYERSDWAKEVWNQLMKELVENHDYTIAHALEELYLFAKFLNVDNEKISKIGIDQWKEKLGNALTFRVEWELLTDVTSSGAFVSKTNSSGEAVISMNQISEKEGYFGEGIVNARIDSYTVVNDGKGVNLPSFNNNARLSNLDPCMRKKITVGFDKFDEGVDFPVQFPNGNVGSTSVLPPAAFYDKYAEGFYTFECDLTNLKENCVDEKISGSYTQGAKLVWTLTIRLFHDPKGDVFMK